MKKQNVILKGDSLFYNEKEEFVQDFINFNDFKNKKIIINVLNEELNTTSFYVGRIFSKNNAVQKIIENNFPHNEDVLYDYKINKNEAYIYSIRAGRNILPIIKKNKNFKIVPFQYIIMQFLNRKIHSKDNIISIIKYENIYYCLILKNRILIKNYVNRDLIRIISEIKSAYDIKFVYSNFNIENSNFKFKIINIEDYLNEKLL
ncbi:hypothetical protein [Clostridium sp. BJN0001]|uniref:hypothetical protein n=1 Tax=Clostridium sp. BJN0001 TaxID=2930219 RepID=UPI001FD50768|nr:hypothetical protein [Clostridium sp. BJN0001]